MKLNSKLIFIFSLFTLLNCTSKKKESEKEKKYYCIKDIHVVTNNVSPATPPQWIKFHVKLNKHTKKISMHNLKKYYVIDKTDTIFSSGYIRSKIENSSLVLSLIDSRYFNIKDTNQIKNKLKKERFLFVLKDSSKIELRHCIK